MLTTTKCAIRKDANLNNNQQTTHRSRPDEILPVIYPVGLRACEGRRELHVCLFIALGLLLVLLFELLFIFARLLVFLLFLLLLAACTDLEELLLFHADSVSQQRYSLDLSRRQVVHLGVVNIQNRRRP